MSSNQKKRRTLEMFRLFGNQNQDSDTLEEMETREKERFRSVIQNLVKNTLTSRQKQVLMLYYYEGISQKAIAAQLGISESSVSHTKKRACSNLRTVLKCFWS